LPNIERVKVFAGETPAPSAWYLGAWVMDVLADIAVKPEFEMRSEADLAGFSGIELSASGWSVELAKYKERLITTTGGIARCNPLRPPTDYSLMREELRITGNDPVFERTVASARRLAGARQ